MVGKAQEGGGKGGCTRSDGTGMRQQIPSINSAQTLRKSDELLDFINLTQDFITHDSMYNMNLRMVMQWRSPPCTIANRVKASPSNSYEG